MNELIKLAQAAGIPAKLIRGQVIALDEERFTVDVQPDDEQSAPLLDVACNVLQDGTGNGVYVLPEIGANVVVVAAEMEVYLLATDKLKRVWMSTEQVSFGIGETIELNGSDAGVPMLPELKNEIEKINAFLDGMRQVFSSWIPVTGDGGLALKTIMVSSISGLPLADLSDENVGNPKVKQ